VVLDLLFIIVFGWGVAGAALATVIAQAGSAIAGILYMIKYFPRLRLKTKELIFDTGKLKLILQLGIPVTLQSAVMATGFILLQRLVNSFEPPSIEGFVAMNKTEQLAHIPGNAFHAAMANFVGQNIRAGKLDRAKRGYKSTILMANSVCLLISIFLLIFDIPLLRLFNISGDSLLRAREHLNIISLFLVVSATSHVTNGFLQGSGDVKIPAIASFVNLSIRLVFAYTAKTIIDFRSIYLSLPPAWLIACIIPVIRYRSGIWKMKAIVST